MRMTAPLERVFRVFLEDPAALRYGYDLMKAAGLPSGSALISETALADGLLNDRLSDVPQQALLGVAIAALLLASTGFCVSIAAGVQQRRAENALLAALGVMPRAAASRARRGRRACS